MEKRTQEQGELRNKAAPKRTLVAQTASATFMTTMAVPCEQERRALWGEGPSAWAACAGHVAQQVVIITPLSNEDGLASQAG